MNVVVVIEDAWTAWLNVAVTSVLVATPVAPDAGVSPVTTGAALVTAVVMSVWI